MIPLDQDRIAAFCQRWKVIELALFGSALRGDFRPDSDVDVMVTFAPDAHPSLFDLTVMEEELGQIFERHVDIVDRRGVEQSRNWIRRQAVLESAEVIYAA